MAQKPVSTPLFHKLHWKVKSVEQHVGLQKLYWRLLMMIQKQKYVGKKTFFF